MTSVADDAGAARQRHAQLSVEITEHQHRYYVLDSPVISDAEFDVLEEPRPGLFGRLRGEARVRARVRPTQPRPKTERRERKRLARMLDNLNDHFILCGFGRMGEIIAREFARQNAPFVVIERNVDRMHLAMD